jgi:hypothetical protein
MIMQHLNFLTFGILLSVLMVSQTLFAQQCVNQVTHLSGTQQVNCSSVTVTPSGSTGTTTLCNKGPYIIGLVSPGSFTFSFNPAVSGVRVGLYGLNNNGSGFEEVAFTVNGAFYPITNPGVADGCLDEAIISGTGTIQACAGCVSSWDSIVISQSISSIKVEDIYLSGAPSGVLFALYFCCPVCTTNAGTIAQAGPYNTCINSTLNFPASTGTVLDNNDILRYILFSNPSDTAGSIIATSNTPSFTFAPPMQTGVTYYLAAVAGDNLNGNVDLADPCLDFSNALQVIWRPIPAVTFSVANPNVCAGACTTVTATFTGTAPFTLTYTSPASGSVTQTFSGNTGTFQVCTSPGSPPGSLVVQATKVVDAWCTCQ